MPLIKNIRELDERITFQEKRTKKDENGDPVEIVTDVGSCWCKVKKQLLKEYLNDLKTLKDTVTFIVRTKQSFEIDHTMKILYKGKAYEIIQSSLDDQDKEYQFFIAELVS